MKITYILADEQIADLNRQIAMASVAEITLEAWTYYTLEASVTISPQPNVAWTRRWCIAYLALELIEAKNALLTGGSYPIRCTESMLVIHCERSARVGFVMMNYQVIEEDKVEVALDDFCKAVDLFLLTLKADLLKFFPGIETNPELTPLFS